MIRLNKKIIVFAPHPDDETLGCGGTIIKRLKEGYEVIIIIMTDGRHALTCHGIHDNPTPEELKQIRRMEAIKATQILGVPSNNVLFWDFEDRTLAENTEEVEKKSWEILNKIKPVEIRFPYEKDANKDHQASSLVLQKCIKKLDFPIIGYQYSIAQRFLHVGPIMLRILNFFRHDLVFEDIFEFIAQKEAAINEYKSQRTIIIDHKTTPMLSDISIFLTRHEMFVFNNKCHN